MTTSVLRDDFEDGGAFLNERGELKRVLVFL